MRTLILAAGLAATALTTAAGTAQTLPPMPSDFPAPGIFCAPFVLCAPTAPETTRDTRDGGL